MAGETANVAEVPRVKASQIPCTDKAIASIDLRSTSNALTDLDSAHEKKSYRLDKLFLILRLNGVNCSAEISTSGAIQCAKQFLPLMDDMISSNYS